MSDPHIPPEAVKAWTGFTFTQEEIDSAIEKWQAVCDTLYANGYTGDFGWSFPCLLQTYSPICWVEFFGAAAWRPEQPKVIGF